MKFICLQSGHEGVTSGATGAPGEQELNVRIRNRLCQVLISKGFIVQLVNANPGNNEIKKDFDLFLALHGDANIYGTGGGLVDYPDPKVDQVTAESKRIKEAIESMYFDNSGIVNHPERSNANTKYYYMWSRLTAKTPCVIMEMGVVQDAHDKVILADTDRVANAIARGICKAFGVPYDQVIPTEPMVTITKNEYEGMKAQITSLSGAVETLTASVALAKTECQNRLQAHTQEIKKKLTDLTSTL
jgi:N-acetylmuramoyl-L-alanine amidase